jgi:membrane associated rhomboid family serine protease
MSTSRRLPILTITTLGLSALMTATRLFTNGPLDALRRDPTALGHGQVWRLISPVLVQSDTSVVNVVLVFVICAAIGTVAERRLSRREWLVLYLCGALAGHSLGEAFQPLEGGTSVAFVGILGGLAASALLDSASDLRRWRFHAAAAIPLSLLDTALGDIHGVSYLVGLAVGLMWLRRTGSADLPLARALGDVGVRDRSRLRRLSAIRDR